MWKRMASFIYTKKIAYLFTVMVGNTCLMYDLYLEKTLTTSWVAALGVLTAFVTTGYLGGKYLLKQEKP